MNSLRHLDLNLLVALDALLEEQSVAAAGKRLHLSPSATSGALARLREYFGDEILTQIGRRMVLTPLGEILRSSVRDCLLHIQSTVELRPGFDPSTSTRSFVLMMSDYVATVLMPPTLQGLQQSARGISIELLSTTSGRGRPWSAARSIFWFYPRSSSVASIPHSRFSATISSPSAGAVTPWWANRSRPSSSSSWPTSVARGRAARAPHD